MNEAKVGEPASNSHADTRPAGFWYQQDLARTPRSILGSQEQTDLFYSALWMA